METVTAYAGPFSDASVMSFYDLALRAALGNPAITDPKHGGLDCAFLVAREATERRFGVKLVLPGDGD